MDRRFVQAYIDHPNKIEVRRTLGLESPYPPAAPIVTALELATRPRAATIPPTPDDDDARLAESVARAIAQKSQQTTPMDNDTSSS